MYRYIDIYRYNLEKGEKHLKHNENQSFSQLISFYNTCNTIKIGENENEGKKRIMKIIINNCTFLLGINITLVKR